MSTKLLGIALVALMFVGCSKVPSGHVGIKVYLLGSAKGVESEELGVGRYWIGFNEELHLFPTYKQNYVWTKDVAEGSPIDEGFLFQTKEGLDVGADIGITYSLQKDKIHSIFQKYRRGVDEITDTFLRNHVRDALTDVVSNMAVDEVYGSGKGRILEQVTSKVRENVEDDGLILEKLYFIGPFRLPKTVVNAINSKIRATQEAMQRENEIQTTIADANKKIEEAKGFAESLKIRAQAEAESNTIITRSLTPALIKYKSIEKWNGALPKVTSSAVPMIDIK